MNKQSLTQDGSFWLRVGLWQLAAPFIKILRLDRFLWKKYVSDKMGSGGWKTDLSEIEARAPFFKAAECLTDLSKTP
jgi:hypothetical protein